MSGDGGYDELVILLSTGIGQRRLYFGGHPRVVACSEDFAAKLGALLARDGRESFFLGVVDGKLVHDGHYLVGSSIAGRKIVDLAANLHSGGFLFRRDVTAAEVRELFGLGAELAEPVPGLPEARALLASRHVRGVDLSPVYEDPGWLGQFLFDGEEAGGMADAGDIEPMLPAYQSLYATVENAHALTRRDGQPDTDGARAASEQLLRSARGGFMDLMQLVRYPDYDSYTVGHSVRVGLIAVLAGQRFGLDEGFLVELGAAGLLHDVGKARVPEEILYKPDRLTPEERAVVQRHAELGAQILLSAREAGPLAVAAAWGHHLRQDGAGYPATPPWAARSRVTALLHICDVFEALTAVRPYKLAMTPRRAYEIMLRDSGGFDAPLLAAFVQAMGLYPPGSRVRLAGGGLAQVVAAGPAIDRPTVRLTNDPALAPLPAADQVVVDLASPENPGLAVAGLLLDETTAPPDAPDRDEPGLAGAPPRWFGVRPL